MSLRAIEHEILSVSKKVAPTSLDWNTNIFDCCIELNRDAGNFVEILIEPSV